MHRIVCGFMAHLIIHGVHPIRSQCTDGLVDQICPPTVQHSEAQVLLEFFSSSLSIQSPEGTEAAFRSVKDKIIPGFPFLLASSPTGIRAMTCHGFTHRLPSLYVTIPEKPG